MNKSKLVSSIKEGGKWLVNPTPAGVSVTLKHGGRAITVRFLPSTSSKGAWYLDFPSYLFRSATSHFRSATPESRFCQNKQMLFSLIRHLKKIGVWEHVENKGFLEVNEDNQKSPKKDLRKALEELLSER